MSEPDARIEFDQSGLDRSRRSFSPDRELLGGSPNQQGFAHGVGGRQLQQTPGVVRKRVELPAEALLDVPREPDRAGQPEATRELRRRQAPYRLQQRQRVAPRLRDDLVTDPRVQGPGEHSVQQDPRIALTQALDHQLGQSRQVIARLPRREHEANRFRLQAARHEREHLRRGAIEPLFIIHQADQRPLLGRLRKQAQDGQADQEAIRRGPAAHAECRQQRIALRGRE